MQSNDINIKVSNHIIYNQASRKGNK